MAISIPQSPHQNQPHADITMLFNIVIRESEADDDQALISFHTLLDQFEKIGPYDRDNWNYIHTNIWWDSIARLTKSPKGSKLLSILKLKVDNEPDNEPLQFFLVEMIVNQPITTEIYKKVAKDAYEKFPHNYELMHNYAHSLRRELNNNSDIVEAIRLYRSYIDNYKNIDPFSQRNYPDRVVESVYNLEINLFKRLREDSLFLEADKTLDYALNYEPYKSNFILRNNLISIKDMFEERKNYLAIVKKSERQFKNTIDEYKTEQDKNSFQQLAVFTAIITFVITAAGSSQLATSTYSFFVGMGLILILFVSTVQIFITPPKSKLDFRFLILYTFIALTIFNIITSNGITISDCLINCNEVQVAKDN